MRKDLERRIKRRAGERCEYCLMPQSAIAFTFPIDHIIARQHGGTTRAENLAFACILCNRHKGPNLAGIDPVTGEMVALFHPRRDRWIDHFEWHGGILVGKTPCGRTTIRVLAMNQREWVAIRIALMDEGVFPPE
jgi:hypothetical protein